MSTFFFFYSCQANYRISFTSTMKIIFSRSFTFLSLEHLFCLSVLEIVDYALSIFTFSSQLTVCLYHSDSYTSVIGTVGMRECLFNRPGGSQTCAGCQANRALSWGIPLTFILTNISYITYLI